MSTGLIFKRNDGAPSESGWPPRLVLMSSYREEVLEELALRRRTLIGQGPEAVPSLVRWHLRQLELSQALPDLMGLPASLAIVAGRKIGKRRECGGMAGLFYSLSGQKALHRQEFLRLASGFGEAAVKAALEQPLAPDGGAGMASIPETATLREIGELGLWLMLCALPQIGPWERLTPHSVPDNAIISRAVLAAATRRALTHLGLELS